ncbi:MAG: hypothetical protein WCW87_04390 [Candidatus Paceibacterota bacterium]
MTSKIFVSPPNYVGDLGRTSYAIDSLSPRLQNNTLAHKHFDGNNWKNEPIDLLTLGDSFSNGGGGGKNPYYQDYLATRLNINILNIQNIDTNFSYIDTIHFLHERKWLNKLKPKAILIQVVVRESLRDVPTKKTKLDLQDISIKNILKSNQTAHFPQPLWINTANYKAPYYYIRYYYSVRAKKEVYRLPLITNFFTAKDQNHLLVYHDDVKNISKFNESSIHHLNAELNVLAEELQREKITLIFMPVVDKYDLYYDYLFNRGQFPENPFFSLLRKEPKKYIFIDTKVILESMLKNDTNDLYYPDDTHWSYKASEKIATDPSFTFLRK